MHIIMKEIENIISCVSVDLLYVTSKLAMLVAQKQEISLSFIEVGNDMETPCSLECI